MKVTFLSPTQNEKTVTVRGVKILIRSDKEGNLSLYTSVYQNYKPLKALIKEYCRIDKTPEENMSLDELYHNICLPYWKGDPVVYQIQGAPGHKDLERQRILHKIQGAYEHKDLERLQAWAFFTFLTDEQYEKKYPDIYRVHQQLKVELQEEALRIYHKKIVPLPKKVKYAGQFTDAYFANDKTLEELDKVLSDARQMKLWEEPTTTRERIRDIAIRGFSPMDFTIAEHRAIRGILALHETRGIKNRVLLDSDADLYEACGLKKNQRPDGQYRYSGRDIERIERAIFDLSRKVKDIVYRQVTGYNPKTKESKYRVITTSEQVLKVYNLYQEIKEGELKEIEEEAINYTPRNKRKPHKRAITLSDVLIAQRSRFKLIPDFYDELTKLKSPKERVSPHELNFHFWLFRHGKGTTKVEISRKKLAGQLKMDAYIKKHQWTLINRIINRCIENALKLKYIKEHRKEPAKTYKGYKDVFILNPEKIPHAQRKEPVLIEPKEPQLVGTK